MFKKIFTMAFLSLFVLMFYYSGVLFAQETIGATVTAQNVSITVTNGNVAYGILTLNTSRSTTGGTNLVGTVPSIQNTGNVDISLGVIGTNSASWTLAGTNGSDTYVHTFCASSCTNPPTNYTPLTLSAQTLVGSLPPTESQTLDLRITTPTSTAAFTQQTVNVTVQASAL